MAKLSPWDVLALEEKVFALNFRALGLKLFLSIFLKSRNRVFHFHVIGVGSTRAVKLSNKMD